MESVRLSLQRLESINADTTLRSVGLMRGLGVAIVLVLWTYWYRQGRAGKHVSDPYFGTEHSLLKVLHKVSLLITTFLAGRS